MHLNDYSSLTLHLKSYFLLKGKFWKIWVGNTALIAHEINKGQLQVTLNYGRQLYL